MSNWDSVYIYFTPQTGVIRTTRPKAPSNYYVYRVPRNCYDRIAAEVELSEISSTGLLTYSKEFLDWLNKVDSEMAQRTPRGG